MQEDAAEGDDQDEWFDAQDHFKTLLPCHQLCNQACLPTHGTPESAGLDLYATEKHVIQPGAQAQIKTGLALALPKGTYGRITP
jgi:dUTPase